MIPLAESAICKIFPNADIDEKELLSLNNVQVEEHIKEVFENWYLIYDKLLPYTRLQLTPKK